MRSVYGRLVLWSVVIAVAGFLLVSGISLYLVYTESGETVPDRYDSVLIESAARAWALGPAELREQLDVLNRHLSGRYYFTDAGGRDVLTGEARLPGPQGRDWIVSAWDTPDRRFKLVEVRMRRFYWRAQLPYHSLLLITVVVLCAALAANLASPLRSLARAVDQFGAGDLNARVHSKRKDEIGDVGRAFDRMADRISTLLTAERRLLQDISHELRSPLARLAFAAELARTAPDRDAAIQRLKKEIGRLTDLVGGLIQVTRAEGDPEAVAGHLLRLDQLITALVDDCRVEAAQRPCRIRWDGTAPAVTLWGDPEVLRRAIENVLRNAIRYTAPDSAIEVQLTVPDPGSARLSIRDFGPGVPQDAVEKIFTPFFRLDDSRDSSTGGIGLGLAIAHRAVALHHGHVWAENAAPGLRVWIELPTHAAKPR